MLPRRLCTTRAARPPRGSPLLPFPSGAYINLITNITRPQPNRSAGKAGGLEKPAPLMRPRDVRSRNNRRQRGKPTRRSLLEPCSSSFERLKR
eukprot:9909111-Alexandrium_andersonii.AAC.1